MSFQASKEGSPGDVGAALAGEIRGEHDPEVDPEAWEHSLRATVADAIGSAILRIGTILVGRDLKSRQDVQLAKISEWRAGVEAKRAEYDALPESEKKGFVAPAEPDFGPLPAPVPIGAEVSGNIDATGITGFTVNISLAPEK